MNRGLKVNTKLFGAACAIARNCLGRLGQVEVRDRAALLRPQLGAMVRGPVVASRN